MSAVLFITLIPVLLSAGLLRAAKNPEASPGKDFSGSLRQTVSDLAEKQKRPAADYARMAEETISFGSNPEAVAQLNGKVPEGEDPHASWRNVVNDALAGVDEGERMDAKAANWPELREKLKNLQPPSPPPPQGGSSKDQKNQKKDQKKKDRQQQSSGGDKSDQKNGGEGGQGQEGATMDQPGRGETAGFEKFGSGESKAEMKKGGEAENNVAMRKVGGGTGKKEEAFGFGEPDPQSVSRLLQVKQADSPALLQQNLNPENLQPKPSSPSKPW